MDQFFGNGDTIGDVPEDVNMYAPKQSVKGEPKQSVKEEPKQNVETKQEVKSEAPQPAKEMDVYDNMAASGVELPPKAQVEEWKKMYIGVYFIVFEDDTVYIFRGMTRSEWKGFLENVSQNVSSLDHEDFIVRKILLFPNASFDAMLVNNLPAGKVTRIADEFMRVMGFTSQAYSMKL